MMVGQPQGTAALHVKRMFTATRERVFEAWANPTLLEKWWAPPGFTMGSVSIDLHAGGCFRIGMVAPDGSDVQAVGMLEEVAPPRRLVFIWEWEGWDPGGAGALGPMRVTVEFRRVDGATEVSLTQAGFPDDEVAQIHAQGWRECLERMGRLIT